MDAPEEWVDAFRKVEAEWLSEGMIGLWNYKNKRPIELKKLLDISPEALKKLYAALRKERVQFERQNIPFNLDIHGLLKGVKSRKLKAFIVVHNYVAWYEWTKRLLYKIYKAKLGKGPKNDEELMKFLDEYPTWKVFMVTRGWEIRANQIRNCVAHEKFYFDYKNSELVFMVKKEKRVRLLELELKISSMSEFYAILLKSLREKVTKGEISYKEPL